MAMEEEEEEGSSPPPPAAPSSHPPLSSSGSNRTILPIKKRKIPPSPPLSPPPAKKKKKMKVLARSLHQEHLTTTRDCVDRSEDDIHNAAQTLFHSTNTITSEEATPPRLVTWLRPPRHPRTNALSNNNNNNNKWINLNEAPVPASDEQKEEEEFEHLLLARFLPPPCISNDIDVVVPTPTSSQPSRKKIKIKIKPPVPLGNVDNKERLFIDIAAKNKEWEEGMAKHGIIFFHDHNRRRKVLLDSNGRRLYPPLVKEKNIIDRMLMPPPPPNGGWITNTNTNTNNDGINLSSPPPPPLGESGLCDSDTSPEASSTSSPLLLRDQDLVALNTYRGGPDSTTITFAHDLLEDFLRLATPNTHQHLETCAFLAGVLDEGVYYVTRLIVPKQDSTLSSCETNDEWEIFQYMNDESLLPLGWVHTHPTQPCFMSSVDVHCHYTFQIMISKAIAIVLAPNDPSRKFGVFRLTSPGGMSVVEECKLEGLHVHNDPPDGGPIYHSCTDYVIDDNVEYSVVDFRINPNT